MDEETIVAIATPPGRGGIGVVRLSGNRACEIAAKLVHREPLETQRATVAAFIDPETGRPLDQVVVTCYHRPHSYTGEDVAEISCHGAPVILGALVECCLAEGARAAEPGEFTLRAFLNGRIDLTQAEAVRDLIESRTLYQARVAAAQLEGAVSARLKPHKQVLLELIAALEAGIDFADDDVPVLPRAEIVTRIEAIRCDLGKLVRGYAFGRIVHEGLSLVIAGRPNVGKSSLFNRLLEENRAIVTATPGTTRDLVAENANLGGIPLRFVDTAGIREAADEAEKIGVEKSLESLAEADLRLWVLDASADWREEDAAWVRKACAAGATIVVLNKSDLPLRCSAEDVKKALAGEGGCPVLAMLDTSALTGAGIAELKNAIVKSAMGSAGLGSEGELITHARHQQLLKQSLDALDRAREASGAGVHHEMLLLDLYEALRLLDALTGATDVEDVLGVIFSKFCVGK